MGKLKYSIQEHDASNLHYDLRLELNGVAKSWAIPKKPSTDPHTKRLAIQVGDHNIEYMNFEGTIEEGYGAGTVKLWDSGTWKPIKENEKEIIADISGEKLKGKFNLIKLEENKWLFFKGKD